MKNIKSWVIGIYAFLGIFNSYIANDKPIIASSHGRIESPCTYDFLYDVGISTKRLYNPTTPYDWTINPLIKYHAQSINVEHSKFSPSQGFREAHFLGTDHLGRDVFAGIIRGCFNSLKIGLFAVLFSLIIGLVAGSAMAYFGNNTLQVSFPRLLIILVLIFLGLFYIYYSTPFIIKFLVIITTSISLYTVMFWPYHGNNSKINLPVDTLFNNTIILRKSIPTLLLILAFLPVFNVPRASNIIIIMAVIGWTNIARHTRAESLSILQKEYVQSAKLLGGGYWHLLRYHIWPLVKPTIGVVAGFAFASFLVIESSLSFLGIGLPPDEVSWGSMIGIARSDIGLWWVALFPSIALFIIIYCFNTLFDNKDAAFNHSII